MADDSIDEKIIELAKSATIFQISLRKESVRGSAIVCATLLEESLYRMIKAKIVLSSKK